MSVIGSNIIAGASGTVETGYQISRSLRFNSADSAHLTRTAGTPTNNKKFTYSTWVKRSALSGSAEYVLLGANTSTTVGDAIFFTNDNFSVNLGGIGSSAGVVTSAVYRDPSSHIHVLVAVDTTQATASNRVKIYFNNIQVTAFGTANYPALNFDPDINKSGRTQVIGRHGNSGYSGFFNGYMADTIFIDGQALDPTSFGEFDANTGVWVPKAYTGTYGTNGFWLKFDDNSGTTSTTLGKDSSGNSNNWTPNNFSVTAGTGNDSLVDSPTNYGTDTGAGGEVRGNYATLNPLALGQYASLSNGNLDIAGNSATNSGGSLSTLGFASGKYYYEFTVTSTTQAFGGVVTYYPNVVSNLTDENNVFGATGTNKGIGIRGSGTTYGNAAEKQTISAFTFATTDVIGVAIDADNGAVYFSKNGTWLNSGVPTSGASKTGSFHNWTPAADRVCHPALAAYTSASGATANFGQRPFAYTAPSGFKALCTTNLPTPAIGASASTLASKNFDATLWTGTGASLNVVNDGGFAPDFVWTKPRNTAVGHTLFDTIRGVTKYLQSNTTGAEGTSATSLTAFNSNGFTVNSDTSTGANGSTYVGWQWKAGGAGVSNTAGSITSTVSANQTAGISVVTYTGNGSAGATIGHGLGVTPAMVIFKNRNATFSWAVFHKAITTQASGNVWDSTVVNIGSKSGGVMQLNLTNAAASYGMDGQTNGNGNNHVAYCFAEIAGFSKFGSYTGNGSADGPFVYCGFRPRWVLLRRTDAIENWILHDTARDTYNVSSNELIPNSSAAEGATTPFDILSNGFKLRSTSTGINGSGANFIFAAFAEAPFNYARAR